ncbi:hypothetical protein HBI42_124380 [Parastagonospora nodorum]|nr:hypothetical protein HBH96_142040 [Parastagonospora nodorum]KAH6216368.1 hypothetical protein HBI43_123410 [Parastagonospora nodorum]KAH6255378.1 hypothetical protein HBI42_124380 [Parastagonospora nodorum]
MKLACIALFAIGAIAAPVVERQAPGGAPPFPVPSGGFPGGFPAPTGGFPGGPGGPGGFPAPTGGFPGGFPGGPGGPGGFPAPTASPPQPHRPETRTFRGDKSSVLTSPLLSHFEL